MVASCLQEESCSVEYGSSQDVQQHESGVSCDLFCHAVTRVAVSVLQVKGGNDVGDGSDTVTACDLSRAVVLCDEVSMCTVLIFCNQLL